MELDKALRQRQAQTGAAAAPVDHVVDLAERLENMIQVFGCDADSGIGNGDRAAAGTALCRTETEPPASVNFIALLPRLRRTCFRRRGSA